MPTWTDNTGEQWRVELDAPTARRIRDELGVDLTSLEPAGWMKLEQDLITLVDALWLLCEEQARDRIDHIPDPAWTSEDINETRPTVAVRGVSQTRFAQRLGGDSLERATEALTQAALNFFPPSTRSALQHMLQRNRALTAAAMEKITTAELDDRMKATIQNELQNMIDAHLAQFGQPTSSPDLSESDHTA